MAGVVHIPWYATGLRHNKLAAALTGIAPIALRYGARHTRSRYRDDLYKFLQTAEFDNKLDFDRYWNGPEFIDFRVLCSSWYQVPVPTCGAIASPPARWSPRVMRRRAACGRRAGRSRGRAAPRRRASPAAPRGGLSRHLSRWEDRRRPRAP